MFGRRIFSIFHGLYVSPDRVQRRLLTYREILHKARRAPLCDVQDVIQNQYLAIDRRTGSDADDRYLDCFRVDFCQSNAIWRG